MSIIKVYKLRDSKGREIILKVTKLKKNLFCINGKSLKFYFEGFDKTKYPNLIEIVEAYGGEFSEPTESTTIFSEEKHATGTGKRYNLEYFRDSIIANRRLDLENYRLPLAKNPQQDVENCDNAQNEEVKLEENHSTSNGSFDAGDRTSIVCDVDTNTPVTTRSVNQNVESCDNAQNEEVKLEENHSTLNESSAKVNQTSPAVTRRSSVNQNKRKVEDDEQLNAEPEKRKLRKRNMNFTYDESTIYDFSISPEKMLTRGRRRSLDSLSFLGNSVEHKTSSNSSFTEEEDRQIIQYLINQNAGRDGSQCVWKEMAADLKTINRSAECLRTHFRIHLRSKYEQYVNAGKEIQGLDVNDREKPWKLYSEEEKRKMIQYLIDNKSNARCGMMKIWEKMAADKIIDRSPASLQMHFRERLRYDYEQYTENAAAREEFEKIIKRKKPETECSPQRRARWSKKDNQTIINYLIENNLIDRVKSKRMWRDVIENVGLTNEHTVFSVQSHFREHLRHNYWEYTTDPEALRKFAVIAKEKDWY